MAQLGPKTLFLIFLVLGSNYLLPFNTAINLFDFYASSDIELPVSPVLFISILNVIYQITAITTNITVFTLRPFLNLRAAKWVNLCCCAGFILLSLLTVMKVKSGYLCVMILLNGICSSLTQSTLDNINLCLIQCSAYKKGILAYASGVNLSGCFHSAILIAIQLSTFNNLNLMASIYYLATGLIIAASGSWAYFMLCSRTAVEELEEVVQPTIRLDILKSSAAQHVLMFCNFFITLFIFPQLTLRTDTPIRGFLLFNPIFVFLLFNTSALLGNIAAYVRPCCNVTILSLILTFRGLILCSFFLCYHNNYLFTQMSNFMSPWIFTLVFSLAISACATTSAYIASCVFYSITKLPLNSIDKVVGLKLVNITLSIALFVGASLSNLYIYLF